jgi:excisionase family DNA binding protein
MGTDSQSEYLTPAQFAQRAGLSLATVRRRIRDGSLPTYQPGGPRTAIRVPASALRSGPSNFGPPEQTRPKQLRHARTTPHWTRHLK